MRTGRERGEKGEEGGEGGGGRGRGREREREGGRERGRGRGEGGEGENYITHKSRGRTAVLTCTVPHDEMRQPVDDVEEGQH